MPNKYALLGLVPPGAPDKCVTSADHALPLLAAEHTAARCSHLRVLRVVSRATRLLRLWRRRMTESNDLRAMSDRELRDFGISRYDAVHEAKRAFWKA